MVDEFPFDEAAVPAATPLSLDEGAMLLEGHLAPEEVLVEPRVLVFPNLGQVVAVGVARSAYGSRLLAVDTGGAGADLPALYSDEEALRFARRGKMTEAAWGHFSEDGPFLATILLSVPIQPLDLAELSPASEDWDLAVANLRSMRSLDIQAANQELRQWLIDAGASDVIAHDHVPTITAVLSPDVLRKRFLHDHDAVLMVDAAVSSKGRLATYAGHGAMTEASLSGGACGGPCIGFGNVGVAIWEGSDGGGTIGTYNDRFWYGDVWETQSPPTSCESDDDCTGSDQGYSCRTPTGAPGSPTSPGNCVAEHATWVAGSVGAYGSYLEDGTTFPRAGAYYTRIYHAKGAGGTFSDDLDWILENGLIYANRSITSYFLGPNSADGRLVDWATRYEQLFVTQEAGNDSTSQTGDRVDCRNFNWVCVGSFFYGDWDDRTDDVRSSFSDWVNDDGSGVTTGGERPHLMGPGDSLFVPDMCSSADGMTDNPCDGTGGGVNGTSFASPAILGAGMLAHNYQGFLGTSVYPIMKKAVLMVSAKDANQDGTTYWQPGVDGKDGAGAPDMARVKAIFDAARTRLMQVTPTQFPTGTSEVTVANVKVGAGAMIRVGMVWNSCPSVGLGGTNVLTDFDLYVYKPTVPTCGGGVVFSDSTLNEVEMVENACLKTSQTWGTYSIRIRKKAGTTFTLCGSETTEPIAVVWDITPAP